MILLKTPLIRQFIQAECGLCCAAMILSYHGARRQINSLREENETGRDGLTVADLSKILQKRGMDTKAYRCGQNAVSSLPLPAIAYWNNQHMVVLDRIKHNYWIVLDPASGKSKIPKEDIGKYYSGIILTAVPGPKFESTSGASLHVFRILGHFMRGSVKNLIQIIIISAMLYSVTLFLPLATEQLVNHSISSLRSSYNPILYILGAIMLYFAISVVRALCMSATIARVSRVMTVEVFRTLLTRRFSFFLVRSRGELLYRLSTLTSLRDIVSGHVTSALLDLGTLVVVMGFALSRSWQLALLVLFLLLLMLIATLAGIGVTKKYTEKEIAASSASVSKQIEAIGTISSIRVGGATSSFLLSWERDFDNAVEAMKSRMMAQGFVGSFTGAVQVFGPFLILAFGLVLLNQDISLGTAVAMQALSATALGSIQSLSSVWLQFIQASVYISRINDITEQMRDDTFGSEYISLTPSIEFDNVSFSYPGAKEFTVKDVSFVIKPGERLAIVGRTGSGKTTIAHLILGLYVPTKGDIRIGGHLLSDFSSNSLYDIVAWVPQDIVLASRSIAENIDYCSDSPDLDKVRKAAMLAGIASEIESMPMGYYTLVSESGVGLSGGQKQRIALARALMREPKIIVLDEATSSLDTVTEAKIDKALEHARCAQVIIAHRLSTITRADRIIVLEQGRVVQSGTHESLMGTPGVYRDLINAQVRIDDRSRKYDPEGLT